MSKQRTHIGTWIIALSLCCILTGRLRAQDIVVNPDAETTAADAQGVSASTATTNEPATVALPELKPATPPLSKDMLLLVNGDQLSGMLQTFQQPGKTFWNRSDIDVPFEFDSEKLDEFEKCQVVLRHQVLHDLPNLGRDRNGDRDRRDVLFLLRVTERPEKDRGS